MLGPDGFASSAAVMFTITTMLYRAVTLTRLMVVHEASKMMSGGMRVVLARVQPADA